MLREIVMDTETTGLDPANGDRLIELGCIEIVNRIPTGREFHRYLNPERDIHRDAVAVHGLTLEFLKDKPLFKDVAEEFLAFIGEARSSPTTPPSTSPFSTPSSSARPGPRCASIAWWIPSCWRGAAIRRAPTASMRCASATASTTPSAPSTAR